MSEIPVGLSRGEEDAINDYVGKSLIELGENPNNPKIEPVYGDLTPGVGGVTSSRCSLGSGCEAYKIHINREEQELYQGLRLTPILHEKTHEAQIKAFPYLPFIWDKSGIEGLAIYSNIKVLEKSGDPKLANIYYNSLSSKYKEYYRGMEELERKGGKSIGEIAKRDNELGELLAKYYPEHLMPEESGSYN